jgi:hypothetical protein
MAWRMRIVTGLDGNSPLHSWSTPYPHKHLTTTNTCVYMMCVRVCAWCRFTSPISPTSWRPPLWFWRAGEVTRWAEQQGGWWWAVRWAGAAGRFPPSADHRRRWKQSCWPLGPPRRTASALWSSVVHPEANRAGAVTASLPQRVVPAAGTRKLLLLLVFHLLTARGLEDTVRAI